MVNRESRMLNLILKIYGTEYSVTIVHYLNNKHCVDNFHYIFMNKVSIIYDFYDTVAPVKLTKAQSFKLHTKGWGIITEYYLESVKINHTKKGITSVATLRIGDILGETTCVVKGPSVSLLFGLSTEEWKAVENMCLPGQQLYYRYFKNGIRLNQSHEQKLFYNFCATNQKSEVLVAKFVKCVNFRKHIDQSAMLEVLELRRCDKHIMDLYTTHLRKK